MTIEQLLGYKASELEALSDEELLKIFAPYLKVTRPEIATGKIHSAKRIKRVSHTHDELDAAKQKANELMKQLGGKNLFNV